MSKCICCGKPNASHEYIEGGYLCEKCVSDERYFVCPSCGKTFDRYNSDGTYADAINGFCIECSRKYD